MNLSTVEVAPQAIIEEIEQRTNSSDLTIPVEPVEAILRAALTDQTATIAACTATPIAHHGTNDSTAIYRVEITWASATRASGPNKANWIVKHWQAGGLRDRALGITQPREILAWEQGWLRPAALPAGLVVPFVGAWRAADGSEAWLAMRDISVELSAYSRMSLSPEQAICRTRAVLARLARFHALWEEAEQQLETETCPWLSEPESSLWDMAPTYACLLGRTPILPLAATVYAPPAWEGLGDDLEAFLATRPLSERRLWEDLMVDRRPLVEGLAGYPLTLLHNDLDDRNIGLSWPGAGAGRDLQEPAVSRLFLIDWEWMGLGVAALDVANIIQRLPILITPGIALPAALWNDDLVNGYFAHYRAAGGRCDAAGWRRCFGLARIAKGLAQMPYLHGSLRRSLRGERPLPQIIGVPEAVIRQNLYAALPMMEKMEEAVIGEAYQWLN